LFVTVSQLALTYALSLPQYVMEQHALEKYKQLF